MVFLPSIKSDLSVILNPTEVKMNDLPDLPLEKIFGYLPLKDRLISRAVSRRWCKTIDGFRLKSLCFLNHLNSYLKKQKWTDRVFAKNFIYSTKFETFFQAFGQSILSNLKCLRLFKLKLNLSVFIEVLNSFDQSLEKLELIQISFLDGDFPRNDLKLNLPMLDSILFKVVYLVGQLVLEAPKLKRIKVLDGPGSFFLVLVHPESVERLLFQDMVCLAKINKLKNLKYLYIHELHQEIDLTFLADLDQMKEIHLCSPGNYINLFKQVQRYDDLKIFYCGCLLNGPNDLGIDSLNDANKQMAYLAQNLSRLADEIPFWSELVYSDAQRVPRESEFDLLNRFIDLDEITVRRPLQDIERFLGILKNFDNIEKLWFNVDQPVELFERLPEHCPALQNLSIRQLLSVADLGFLFRLKHLENLSLNCSIEPDFSQKAFDELPFLYSFSSNYLNEEFFIFREHSNKFMVWLNRMTTSFRDLKTAIEFIVNS